jgi:hypothetical protein
MGEDLRARSTREVLDDHWWIADNGAVEQTLERNIHPDVVLLTSFRVYRGHDGFLTLHRRLREQLPSPQFTYRTRLAHGEVGFLQWTAACDDRRIDDGADTYLVRDGWIVIQTIHYTVARDRGDAPAQARPIEMHAHTSATRRQP